MVRVQNQHTVHAEAHAVRQQVPAIVDPVPHDKVPSPGQTDPQSVCIRSATLERGRILSFDERVKFVSFRVTCGIRSPRGCDSVHMSGHFVGVPDKVGVDDVEGVIRRVSVERYRMAKTFG